MRHIRILVAIATFLMPLESTVAAEPLKLICAYSYTVDAKGQSNSTTGEILLTVNKSGDGHAVIKKQGLGAEFVGSVSEDVIRGETAYQIQGVTYKETLDINRVTGAFTFTFGNQSGAALVHHGTCRPASKPLF